MKCAYNAGILDAFLDEGISFDYCIGVSGGSGNLASYLAGQRGRNLRFFTEHIHDKEYFGMNSFLKTGNLFGLSYIYGTLTNTGGKDPLDFPALMKNPAEYQVVVTNAETGKPEYYGKERMAQDDYRLIMASSAIPAACRPVEINGTFYYDGGISDAIPVQHALAKDCDRLVVILSKTRDYVRKPQGMHFLYSRICRRYPRIVERSNSVISPITKICGRSLRWRKKALLLFLLQARPSMWEHILWMRKQNLPCMIWGLEILKAAGKN